MKESTQSAYSLVEMLVATGIFGLLIYGASLLVKRSQENGMREALRQNYGQISGELNRRLAHQYKRHISKQIEEPYRMVLNLPSSTVRIETVCVENETARQDPGQLLRRCMNCDRGQRPIIRIQSGDKVQYYPSLQQKLDMPAGGSLCFSQGSDPSEVAYIAEFLVVDPINPNDRKVHKVESLLVKEAGKFTLFE